MLNSKKSIRLQYLLLTQALDTPASRAALSSKTLSLTALCNRRELEQESPSLTAATMQL